VRGRLFKAFTLIEFMISIAILAIVLSISVHSLFQFRGLHRDRSFSESLQQAPQHMAALRAEKFDNLPPHTVVVGQGGHVQLPQTQIVEGTVEARSSDGIKELKILSHSNADGAFTLDSVPPGTKVLVNYAFHLPHQNESHFLDSEKSSQLSHRPVAQVRFVALAQGSKLTKTSDYQVDDNGNLTVPGGQAGQLLVVDYLGGQNGNIVRGKFLDPQLSPSMTATDTKLMEVGEAYRGPFRASLAMLKVRDD
jgi:prepilin-type N-terminal cleavage/methylation domain-containing protein